MRILEGQYEESYKRRPQGQVVPSQIYGSVEALEYLRGLNVSEAQRAVLERARTPRIPLLERLSRPWMVANYAFDIGERGQAVAQHVAAKRSTLPIVREGATLISVFDRDWGILPQAYLEEQLGMEIAGPGTKAQKRLSRAYRSMPFGYWLGAEEQGAFPIATFPTSWPYGGEPSEKRWDSAALIAEEAVDYLTRQAAPALRERLMRTGRFAGTILGPQGEAKPDLFVWPRSQMPDRAMLALPEDAWKPEVKFNFPGGERFIGLEPREAHAQANISVQLLSMNLLPSGAVSWEQVRSAIIGGAYRHLEQLRSGQLGRGLPEGTPEQVEQRLNWGPSWFSAAGGRLTESPQMTAQATEEYLNYMLKRGGNFLVPLPGTFSAYLAPAAASPDPRVREMAGGQASLDWYRAALYFSDPDVLRGLQLSGSDFDDLLKVLQIDTGGLADIIAYRDQTERFAGEVASLINPEALQRVPNVRYPGAELLNLAIKPREEIPNRYVATDYTPPNLGATHQEVVNNLLPLAAKSQTDVGFYINTMTAYMMERGTLPPDLPFPTDLLIDAVQKDPGATVEIGDQTRLVREVANEWGLRTALELLEQPVSRATWHRLKGPIAAAGLSKRPVFRQGDPYDLFQNWLTGTMEIKEGAVGGFIGQVYRAGREIANVASPPVELLEQVTGDALGKEFWAQYRAGLQGTNKGYKIAGQKVKAWLDTLSPAERNQAILQAMVLPVNTRGELSEKALWLDPLFEYTKAALVEAGVYADPRIGEERAPDLGNTPARTLRVSGTGSVIPNLLRGTAFSIVPSERGLDVVTEKGKVLGQVSEADVAGGVIMGGRRLPGPKPVPGQPTPPEQALFTVAATYAPRREVEPDPLSREEALANRYAYARRVAAGEASLSRLPEAERRAIEQAAAEQGLTVPTLAAEMRQALPAKTLVPQGQSYRDPFVPRGRWGGEEWQSPESAQPRFSPRVPMRGGGSIPGQEALERFRAQVAAKLQDRGNPVPALSEVPFSANVPGLQKAWDEYDATSVGTNQETAALQAMQGVVDKYLGPAAVSVPEPVPQPVVTPAREVSGAGMLRLYRGVKPEALPTEFNPPMTTTELDRWDELLAKMQVGNGTISTLTPKEQADYLALMPKRFNVGTKWYTSGLETAQKYAKGGAVFYLDVQKEQARSWLREARNLEEDFLVPWETARNAVELQPGTGQRGLTRAVSGAGNAPAMPSPPDTSLGKSGGGNQLGQGPPTPGGAGGAWDTSSLGGSGPPTPPTPSTPPSPEDEGGVPGKPWGHMKYPLRPEMAAALESLKRGENVILSAPTGYGKTSLISAATAELKPGLSVITAPLKLLGEQLAEKFQGRFNPETGEFEGGAKIPAVFLPGYPGFNASAEEMTAYRRAEARFYGYLGIDPQTGNIIPGAGALEPDPTRQGKFRWQGAPFAAVMSPEKLAASLAADNRLGKTLRFLASQGLFSFLGVDEAHMVFDPARFLGRSLPEIAREFPGTAVGMTSGSLTSEETTALQSGIGVTEANTFRVPYTPSPRVGLRAIAGYRDPIKALLGEVERWGDRPGLIFSQYIDQGTEIARRLGDRALQFHKDVSKPLDPERFRLAETKLRTTDPAQSLQPGEIVVASSAAMAGIDQPQIERVAALDPHGMNALIQGLGRLRAPGEGQPARERALVLRPETYYRRAEQMEATATHMADAETLASYYQMLQEGEWDPNWKVAANQMQGAVQRRLVGEGQQAGLKGGYHQYFAPRLLSFLQQAGLIELGEVEAEEGRVWSWKFGPADRTQVPERIREALVKSSREIDPLTKGFRELPVWRAARQDIEYSAREQHAMGRLAEQALYNTFSPEEAGQVIERGIAAWQAPEKGGLEGLEYEVGTVIPKELARRYVAAVQQATELHEQEVKVLGGLNQANQNYTQRVVEAEQYIAGNRQAQEYARAAGAAAYTVGAQAGAPAIAALGAQVYVGAGGQPGAVPPAGGAVGGPPPAGGMPPIPPMYVPPEEGGAPAARGRGMWGGRVGGVLYAAYLGRRFWQMAAEPVIQGAYQYAGMQAQLTPLAQYGEEGPVALTGAAALPAQQQIAQLNFGRAGYELFGPFMQAGYQISQRPTLARFTQAAEMAGGLLGGGYMLGMMAGMLGPMVPAAAGALGAVSALAAPVGLTLAAGTMAYWAVDETRRKWQQRTDAYALLGKQPVTPSQRDLQAQVLRWGLVGGQLEAKYPTLTPEEQARYTELHPDMVQLANQLSADSHFTITPDQAAGIFAETARITGKTPKPGTPEWQFAIRGSQEAGKRGVEPAQYLAQAGQYAAAYGYRYGEMGSKADEYLTLPPGQQQAVEGAAQYGAYFGLPGTPAYQAAFDQYRAMGVPQQAQALAQQQLYVQAAGQYPRGAVAGLGALPPAPQQTALARLSFQGQFASQLAPYLGGQVAAFEATQQYGFGPTLTGVQRSYLDLLDQYGFQPGQMAGAVPQAGIGVGPNAGLGAWRAVTRKDELFQTINALGPRRAALLQPLLQPLLAGGVSPNDMAGVLRGLGGYSDYQVGLLGQVVGGDTRAISYASYFQPQLLTATGFPSAQAGRFYDLSGNPIWETSGAQALQWVGGQAAMGNFAAQQVVNRIPQATAPPGYMAFGGAFLGARAEPSAFAQAQGLLGISDAGLTNAWLQGGNRGMQINASNRLYDLQMASIGVGYAQIAAQEQYLWGGGAWTGTPAPGSMWSLEDRQRRLQHQAQLASFAYQGQRMEVTNQFAVRQEQLGYERMTASQDLQRWQRGFDRGGMMLQQGWAREDWQYQDQMRGLQFGWNMEDLNRAIRFSTGRERQQLIRQRERTALTFNLEGEQIEKGRDRQEQLWAREDQRFRKQTEYSEKLMGLDQRQFELQKEQREQLYEMERAELQRHIVEYQKQYKLQLQITELSRDYQAQQLQFQKASLGIQAESATLQHELETATRNTNVELGDVTNEFELIAKYGEQAKRVLPLLSNALINAANLDADTINALTRAIQAIGSLDVSLLRQIANLLAGP